MTSRNVRHGSYICLLVAAGLLPALSSGAELQPVAREFCETLTRISAAAVKPPEAVAFPPRDARFVRVDIQATSGNSQPGIDEIEVFGPDGKDNLALAERGSVASASSVIAGYPIHQIKHLNDGRYGNAHSWIAATRGRAWVQIELPKTTAVARPDHRFPRRRAISPLATPAGRPLAFEPSLVVKHTDTSRPSSRPSGPRWKESRNSRLPPWTMPCGPM